MKLMKEVSKTIQMHPGGQPPLAMHSGGGGSFNLKWKCTQCMRGWRVAPPLIPGGWIYISAWVMLFVGVSRFLDCCLISCFEIVPHRFRGQPFCIMSMDALEMIVKYTTSIVCCKLAKSGGVSVCSSQFRFRHC